MTDADIRGREHYSYEYDHRAKWALYWEQIQTIMELPEVKKVLIIGPGNGIVPYYLRQQGLIVHTVDVDESLHPDIVGDVRSLTSVVRGLYDVAVVAHVLEHIPFSHLSMAFTELAKVSRRILYSGPHFGLFLEVDLHVHGWRPFASLAIPVGFLAHRDPYKIHQWELGKRGYTEHQFRQILHDCHLEVLRDWRPPNNAWSHYFLLGRNGR